MTSIISIHPRTSLLKSRLKISMLGTQFTAPCPLSLSLDNPHTSLASIPSISFGPVCLIRGARLRLQNMQSPHVPPYSSCPLFGKKCLISRYGSYPPPLWGTKWEDNLLWSDATSKERFEVKSFYMVLLGNRRIKFP